MITWFKRAFTGHPGVEGIAGAPGPQGPQGPKGDPGVSARTPRAPKFSRALDTPKDYPTPQRAYKGDAGYDLALRWGECLLPGEVKTVCTGVCVDLDPATVGLIFPRSSMANRGINTLTGVVDSGYHGELLVTLHNATDRKKMLARGERVAQLVVTPVVVDGRAALTPERGTNGFGSSGKGEIAHAVMDEPHELERWQKNVIDTILEGNAKDIDTLLEDEQDGTEPAKDMVNHPPHYASHPVFARECHYYSKYMTFDQGNAFKYLWRCESKGDMRENLDKAVWYINAMFTGPVERKYGIVLRIELLHELSGSLNKQPGGGTSIQHEAAIYAYWACAHLANGRPSTALLNVRRAIKLLDGVQ